MMDLIVMIEMPAKVYIQASYNKYFGINHYIYSLFSDSYI